MTSPPHLASSDGREPHGRDESRHAGQHGLDPGDHRARRDERAFQNRKLDMQEARLDRKDRQAAIQAMMAGLSQLGASIAI